ncbi:MAG: hypothetical protein K6E51_14270 [Treponema sp.]|nr:hypothetical protein [Treponema sp.]
MRILELKDINREDVAIYYRRTFTAKAVVEIPASSFEIPISFTIETGPLGNKEFILDAFKSNDYPIIPLRKAILQFITTMDAEGKLP